MGCSTCEHNTQTLNRNGIWDWIIYCKHFKCWKEADPRNTEFSCLYDTSDMAIDVSDKRAMTTEERIYSLINYLKYDYCHDRITNYYYREYLTLLHDASDDVLTKSKLDLMLMEIRGKT